MAEPRQIAELMGTFGYAYVRFLRSESEKQGETSPARARVLKALSCEGRQRMGDLGTHLGVTPRYVTRLVDDLEAEGLVKRVPDPEDRRAIFVEITEGGRDICEELFRSIHATSEELFAELTEGDREDFARVIRRLTEGLRRRGF